MTTTTFVGTSTVGALHTPWSERVRETSAALVLGAVGVVYGDIGTSPLYALRESLQPVAATGPSPVAVLGVVSLILWALIFTVTIKYVLFLLRADNHGEGGTLSLMALAQRATGGRTQAIFLLGVIGAALFYGDALITPAISVMSAVEGLKLVSPVFDHVGVIIPISLGILVALFWAQKAGTQKVAALFGPIMLLWFLAISALSIPHLLAHPEILWSINPYHGLHFLSGNGRVGFVVLGAVFLAVTGAEALYADMGHFGRKPITQAWLYLVFPALALSYLGQGALLLGQPEAIKDPFFLMAPAWALLPMVLLATAATVIASQAVITGAYSLTQQAIQLGLLPRLSIRHTSEQQAGQIYMPQINWLLLVGVVYLVLNFKGSSALASAYGIAVTGTMVVTTALAFVILRRKWKWSLVGAAAFITPFLLVDLTFLAANLLKISDGGYVPLLLGFVLIIVMWTWARGTAKISEKFRQDAISIADLTRMLERSKPFRVQGTAVYLTNDPNVAPSALLHNLKHNRVLHHRNIVLTIRASDLPYVPEDELVSVTVLSDDFIRLVAKFGYMESPSVPRALAKARARGVEFDIMQTSFFLGRFQVKAGKPSSLPFWQYLLFAGLARFANDATDSFDIPSSRVVWMGGQVKI
jgi:KUP system potassium uptake protein